MNVCADCDWFALEPGKRRSGACLAKWIPFASLPNEERCGVYGRALSFDDACDDFAEIGTLKRLEPERITR